MKLLAPFVFFLLLSLGISQSYCEPTGFLCTGSFINKLSTIGAQQNINNNSGRDSSGYGDYSAQDLLLDSAFQVRFSASINDSSYLQAWVDWNQDGDFIDNNEYVYSGGSSKRKNFLDSIGIVWSLTENGGALNVVDTVFYSSIPASGSCSIDRMLSYPFDSSKTYSAFASLYCPTAIVDSHKANDTLSFMLSIDLPFTNNLLGPDTVLCDSTSYELRLPASVGSFIWDFPSNSISSKSLFVNKSFYAGGHPI